MSYFRIFVNIQNIETETDKAILVRMHNNSSYPKFKFWFPKRLVGPGKHSYEIMLKVPFDFKVRLFKNGQGQYNKFEVIASKEISASELFDEF